MPYVDTGGYGDEQDYDLTVKVTALKEYLPELDSASLFTLASSGADYATMLSQADKMVSYSALAEGVSNLKAQDVERQAATWAKMPEERRALYMQQGYVPPEVQQRQADTDKTWWQTGLEALGFVPSKMKDVVVGGVATGVNALTNAVDFTTGRPWRAVHQMSQDEQFAQHGLNLNRARFNLEKRGDWSMTDDEWRAMFSRYQERNPHTYEGGFLSGASDRINPNPWASYSGQPLDEQKYREFEQMVYAVEAEPDNQLADWSSAWGATASGEEYIPPSVQVAAMDLMSDGMGRYSEGMDYARYRAIGKSREEYVVDKLGVDPNDTGRIHEEASRLASTYENDLNWNAGYRVMADDANRITMGRDIADGLHLDRNSAAHTLASGGVDAFLALSLDPTMYAGRAIKLARGTDGLLELTKAANMIEGIDKVERTARAGRALKAGEMLRDGVEFGATISDDGMAIGRDLKSLREFLAPHMEAAGLDKIDDLWDESGKATRYLRDNYEKVKQVIDAGYDDAIGMTSGDTFDRLEAAKLVLDDSSLITTDPARIASRAELRQAAASWEHNERIAEAFRQMEAAEPADKAAALTSLYKDLPKAQVANDALVEYHNVLKGTRGYGIESAEDIYNFFRTEGAWLLPDGRIWSSALRKGEVRLPTRTTGSKVNRWFVNRTEDLMNRARMAGTPLEARGLKIHELEQVGSEVGGLKWQALRPVRASGKLSYSLSHHAWSGTGFDLTGPDALEKFSKIVNAGAFSDMDQALISRFLGEFAADTSAVGRRQIYKSFLNDMFARVGAFDDPKVGEHFSDIISRLTTHRYAPDGRDIIKIGSQERRVAILPTGQESTWIEIPDFREIASVVHDLGEANHVLGVVNRPMVDAFTSKLWKPSLLLRLGFVPRTAGEELMTHIARQGFGRGLREYVGQKAVSSVSVGDWFSRMAAYRGLRTGSLTRNEAREILQWQHAVRWDSWQAWMAKEVQENLGRAPKWGDKFAFFADFQAARLTKRIKNLELLAASPKGRDAAMVALAANGYDLAADPARLYRTYAEHAEDAARTISEILTYSAFHQDSAARVVAGTHGMLDAEREATRHVRDIRVAASRREARGEEVKSLALRTDGTMFEGLAADLAPDEVQFARAHEYTTWQNAPAGRAALQRTSGIVGESQAADALSLLRDDDIVRAVTYNADPLQSRPAMADFVSGTVNVDKKAVKADWKAGMASVAPDLKAAGVDASRLADALGDHKGYAAFLEARESHMLRQGIDDRVAAQMTEEQVANAKAYATQQALDDLGIEWDTVALRRQPALDLTTYNPGEALMTDEQRAERMAREAVGPVPPMTREEFKAGRAEFQAAAKARIEEIEQAIGELDFGRPPRKHTRTDRITGQKKKVRGFKDAGGFKGGVGWDELNGLSDEDEAYLVKLLGGYADTQSTAGDPSSAIAAIEGLRKKGNSWAGVLPAIDEATTGDDMVVLLKDLADEHRALRQALGEINGSADIKLVRRALPYEDERHFAAFMSERQPRGKRRMVRDENGNAVLSPEGKRQFKSESSGAAPPLSYEERIALHRENLGSINDEYAYREQQRILGEGLDPVEDDLTALSDDELKALADDYGIAAEGSRDEMLAAVREASLTNPEPLPLPKKEAPWQATRANPDDGLFALRRRERAYHDLPDDLRQSFYDAVESAPAKYRPGEVDPWVLQQLSSRRIKTGPHVMGALTDGDPGNQVERAVASILRHGNTKEARVQVQLLEDLLTLPKDTAMAVMSDAPIRFGDATEEFRRAMYDMLVNPDRLGEGLWGLTQEDDLARWVAHSGAPVARPVPKGDRPFYGVMAEQSDIDAIGQIVEAEGIDGFISRIKDSGINVSKRDEQMLGRMLVEWDTEYQSLVDQGRRMAGGGSMRPVTRFAVSRPDDSSRLAFLLSRALDPEALVDEGLVRSSYAYVPRFDQLDEAGRALVGAPIEDVPGMYRMAEHQHLKQTPRDRLSEVRYNELGEMDEAGDFVAFGVTPEESAEARAAAVADLFADRFMHNGRVMHDIVEPVIRGQFHAGVLDGRAVSDMPAKVIGPRMYVEDGKDFLGRAVKYGYESILAPASDAMIRSSLYNFHLIDAMRAADALDPVLRNSELWENGVRVAADAGLDAEGVRALWRSLGDVRHEIKSPAELREALNEAARATGVVEDALDPAVTKRLAEIREEYDPLRARLDEWDETLTDAEIARVRELAEEEAALIDAETIVGTHPVSGVSDEDAAVLLQALKHDDTVREQVAKVAHQRAYNDTIPYIDDHNTRSFFQVYARNLMPFQFAQEQFLKRWARAAIYDPVSLERARLMTHAVESSAFVHEDPKTGKKMFAVPFSEAFTKLIPKVLGVFGVEAEIPMGVPLTFDVNNVLAGGPRDLTKVPSLHPILMLPTQWAGNRMPEFRKAIGQPLMGDFAATTDNSLIESFMPQWAANVYRGVWNGPDAQREITQSTIGAMQAMRAEALRLRQEGDGLIAEGKRDEAQAKYDRARELDPPDDDSVTPEEHQAYLDNVTMWARTIAISKGVFGFFSPGSPTEDVDTLELAPEFREKLAYMSYDEALAGTLADHPEMQPYTIFRTQKDSDAPLPATEEALKWMSANGDFLRAFPKAAPWLMPQQKTGDEFSMDAYNDEMATGLRRLKAPDEFYADMKVAAAGSTYFDTQEQVNFLKEQYADNPEAKKIVTDWWSRWSTEYRNTHPLFAKHLAETGGAGKKEVIDELELALRDPALPDEPRAVKMREALQVYRAYEVEMLRIKGDTRKPAKETRERLRNWLVDYGDGLIRDTPELSFMWRNLIEQEAGVRSIRTNRRLRSEMQDQQQVAA